MPFKRKKLDIQGTNLWYLVGLITSDGSLSKDGRHIDITSKDYEFLRDIRYVTGIKSKIGIKFGSKKNQKAFRIQIGNKNFYNFLLSIGLMPNKSLILKNLAIPDEFFKDFLRGLIDGDGGILRWIHPKNFREQWVLRITSGSKKFLEWLSEKIENTFKAKGRIYQKNEEGTQFEIKFGKVAARKILKICYYENCFSLERKKRLAQECINSYEGWKRSKTIFSL